MGGRGAGSASSAQYYATQRAGFKKIADQAEKSSSYKNKLIARTARAAESLVGTERGEKLVNDWNVNQIKTEMERAYAIVGANALSNLESMLDNEALNNPLGSGYTHAEWQGVKDAVQGYVGNLEEKGYTVDEIAAAVGYGQYFTRRETSKEASKSKSSNMVTSYRNGQPELVPRYRKSVNGSKTANTYTTKQFAQYTGIILPADVMTFRSGKPSQEVFKIADIHKGHYGAWLQGQNNGNGFAVGVYKDNRGWYMKHRRLGHTDENGEYTERIYLEKLKNRIGF